MIGKLSQNILHWLRHWLQMRPMSQKPEGLYKLLCCVTYKVDKIRLTIIYRILNIVHFISNKYTLNRRGQDFTPTVALIGIVCPTANFNEQDFFL